MTRGGALCEYINYDGHDACSWAEDGKLWEVSIDRRTGIAVTCLGDATYDEIEEALREDPE